MQTVADRPEAPTAIRTDLGAIFVSFLSRQKELEGITGKVEPVWVKQLLEKAKRSPLVQMMESDRPADRKFASKFLATHDCE